MSPIPFFRNTAYIHGLVPVPVRNAIEARFTNEKYPRVLVCSPGAAGDSLNLQRARTSIYVSRPVSLTDYQQSLNRICRREAKGTSIIMHIVVPNTIDDWLTELLARKANISDALMLGQDKLEQVDKGHLLEFLKKKVRVARER
jgi:SNF2 family DNA or RNA helicase